MIGAEQEFWGSFDYDPAKNVWSLAPGVCPMDILEISKRKLWADAEAVAKAVDF